MIMKHSQPPITLLRQAAGRLDPKDAPRYNLVIDELERWVTALGPWPKTEAEILDAYRSGALGAGLNIKTIYTRISRIRKLLAETVKMGQPVFSVFDGGFPPFKRPRETGDERRWKAYENFVTFCHDQQISYVHLSSADFTLFRDSPIKGSALMMQTRYGDLKRFWNEKADSGLLKSIIIPSFDSDTRTFYGLAYERWPTSWKQIFERFQAASQCRPLGTDKP